MKIAKYIQPFIYFIIALFLIELFQPFISSVFIKAICDNLKLDSWVIKIGFPALIVATFYLYGEKIKNYKWVSLYYLLIGLIYLLYRFDIISHSDWAFSSYCWVINFFDVFFTITFIGFTYIICYKKEKKKETNEKQSSTHSPIKECSKDKLQYKNDIVNNLLPTLLDKEENKKLYQEEALTVSLRGNWGAGKTSYLNLIDEQINKDSKFYGRAIIVKFNPWFSSDTKQIMQDFLDTLREGLKDKLDHYTLQTSINKYAQALAKGNFGTASKLLSLLPLGGDESIEKRFSEVSNNIAKLPVPLMIFIDDIDRLDAKEIQYVLQLVRNSANFKNTIFIVPYDEEYIVKTLDTNLWNPQEYLQKIFTLSYSLPIIPWVEYVKMATTDIAKQLSIEAISKEYECIKSFIKDIKKRLTLRTLRKITENINFHDSFVKDDGGNYNIYLYDLLLIEYLNILDKNIYTNLPQEDGILWFNGSHYSLNNRNIEAISKNIVNNESNLTVHPNDEFIVKSIKPICLNTAKINTSFHILELLFNKKGSDIYSLGNPVVLNTYFAKIKGEKIITQKEFSEGIKMSEDELKNQFLKWYDRNKTILKDLLNSVEFKTKEEGLKLINASSVLKQERGHYYLVIPGVNSLYKHESETDIYKLHTTTFKTFLDGYANKDIDTLKCKNEILQRLKEDHFSPLKYIFSNNSQDSEKKYNELYISYLQEYLKLQKDFADFETSFIANLDQLYHKNEAQVLIKEYLKIHFRSLVNQVQTTEELSYNFYFNKLFDEASNKKSNWKDNYKKFLDQFDKEVKNQPWFQRHLEAIGFKTTT
ncbi:P-loop NTPase fold protein [Dysgonomonas sp. ZJ709]|uniref:KAP family P-loop NTPase fold protein n=1 Tax=Dysgonomonas sp. ZJ709 TaxID=2709797 RepID=UPI0013EA08D4|nr:P-loop NTPase fold protein [Dysgonomonas sp. ZJ709]